MSHDNVPNASDIESARHLMGQFKPGKAAVALLSTVSLEGRPHATWMFASLSSESVTEILTITSPDSDKVKNVRAVPGVEWLISSHDRMEHLYLEGDAEVVEDVSEIKRLWEMIGGKERVFFMKYYNSGIGFTIIRTRISSAVYAKPEDYRKVDIPLKELV
jgi:general stress protein 26